MQLLVEMSWEDDQSMFSHPQNHKMFTVKSQILSIRNELQMKKMVSLILVIFDDDNNPLQTING